MTNGPDPTTRRDELRNLSQSRIKAGLNPFPSAEEVEEIASKFSMRKTDAHDYLMHEGERILENSGEIKANEEEKGAETSESTSEGI